MAGNRLHAGAIAELGAGNHPDGGNLYLRVIGGSRTYSFRYKRAGRSHWLTLGSAENWSLAEARKRARAYRRRLDDGEDLAASVRAAREPLAQGKTFAEVLALYLEAHQAGWRNAKHGAQWQATLNTHAASLMNKPVRDITVEDVLAVLKPIWHSKTETASRVRGRLETVLNYATARHWRAGLNPARWKGHLDALLPARAKVQPVRHHVALPWQQMPTAMARLVASKGVAAKCVAFAILTAARSAEARGATWSEITHLDAEPGSENQPTWVIPAGRMKGGKEHRVPLAPEVVSILRAMLPLRSRGDLVFPGGVASRPLSDVSLSKAWHLATHDNSVTVHGSRSTFRDYCGEKVPVAREVVEKALAHGLKDKVEAAYARSDLLELRRPLMATWASFVSGFSGTP